MNRSPLLAAPATDRPRGRALVALGLCLAIFGTVLLAQPASAAPVDLDDAQTLVATLAPDALVGAGPSSGASVNQGQGSAPTVTIPPATPDSHGIAITIVDAQDARRSSGPISVFGAAAGSARSYVLPTNSGVRLMTVLASAQAPRSFSYDFDVPAGTELVGTPNGYRLQPPEGISYGTLDLPWAVDGSGRQVPTSYSWDHNRLTQTVDLSSPGISFPVIMDPTWGYTLEWTIGSVSPGSAWSKLHTCFNCYFPIAGAPRIFPRWRQDLPLTVSMGPITGSFHCVMDDVWSFSTTDYGFQFLSAAGHVDGPGSVIAFELYRDRGGSNRLSVGAAVTTDFGPLRDAYVAGAALTWKKFADNLRSVVIVS